MTTQHLAEAHSFTWLAQQVVSQNDLGVFHVYASLDGQLWDVEFTPVDGRRIQLVATGLESFDAAQMAAAEHYAKLKGA
jgi:hypothetical protein